MVEKIFFNKNNLKIINDDFITTNLVEENSIDLIVTSPPYNVDINYASFGDNIPYEYYLVFTGIWLKKCLHLLKEDGRACINIPLDKNKGGQQSVYADFVTLAKNIGFKYHTTIIWNEQNISRRTAWGSWLSATAPYIIAPVETIVVLYKSDWKRNGENKVTTIKKEEFIEWTNGMWTFTGESKKRIGHPAPYPIELPRRCIKLCSYEHDTILDPFFVSGTTLIPCFELNRKGIGIEVEQKYCEIALNRLINEANIYQKKLTAVI